MEDVSKSGYYKTTLRYDDVDWFVDEVVKVQSKTSFYFKNTKNDNFMTEEDEEDFKSTDFCEFYEKEILSDKVRDHCHLTGNYRVPAHSKGNINVTQVKNITIPVVFHNFTNYDCHLFFEKLVDKRNDKVKFDITPKTNEEHISVTYGCVRSIHSYRYLSSSLDSLVITLVDNSHKALKDLAEKFVEN